MSLFQDLKRLFAPIPGPPQYDLAIELREAWRRRLPTEARDPRLRSGTTAAKALHARLMHTLDLLADEVTALTGGRQALDEALRVARDTWHLPRPTAFGSSASTEHALMQQRLQRLRRDAGARKQHPAEVLLQDIEAFYADPSHL